MAAPPRLIDAHLHLQDPPLIADLPGVLARAAAAGIDRLVVNGTREEDWPAVLALAQAHPQVVPCFGLHPWYVAARSPRWLQSLEEHLQAIPSAIGEIGLDRWITPRDEAGQEQVFRAQLDLACHLGRPVMIHSLRASDWMLQVLKSQLALPPGLLFHAFGGPAEMIGPLADLGARFSFGGSVLHEGHTRARQALLAVGPHLLLLETDSPDMPPPPEFRRHALLDAKGNPLNEPANLAGILTGVAALRGQDPDDLAALTCDNARRLLGDLIR